MWAPLAVLDPCTRPSGGLELEDLQALIAERLPLLAQAPAPA